MKSFIQLLAILIISALSFSCTGKNSGDTIPIRKGGAGGGGGIGEKPDKKAEQAALKANVLVLIDKKKTLVTTANLEGGVIKARLKVNNLEPFQWQIVMKVKKGDALTEVQTLSDDYGLGEHKLGLTVQGKRIEKKKDNNNKDDLGYLVLSFQLGHTTDDQDKSVKSLQLVIVDLNKVKNPNAIYVSQTIFPIPEDFSLEKWIDIQLKRN